MIIRTLSQTRPLLFSALLLKVGLAFAYSVPFVSEQAGELEMQLHMAQPTGETASAPDAAQLQQALRLVEAGKLSEALQIAQRSVATFPNSAASQEILGVVLGLSGDIANSRKAFEKALSIESRRWTAMVKLGDLAYAEKQLKQAEAHYRAAAAINPADGQLAQRLGLIEVANGNLTAAASQFEKGVAVLQDDVVSVRPYLGAIYNLRGEYQRTLDLFKSVPLDKVKHYAAYMVVAEAKFRLGKTAEALALLEKARAAAPRNPAPWLMTGRIARQAGDYRLAISALTESLRLRPNAPGTEMELALAEISSGKAEAGIKRAEAVAKGAADNPFAALGLAQVYAAADKRQQAIDAYKALLPTPSVARKATFGLARELEKDGRFAESEELMAAQVRKDPRDIDALQHLGSIQATQRKYKEAIASFESGLVLAPDDPNLLRLCSIAYAKLGDYRKAIQLAEKLTRVVPKSNAALLLLAVNTEDAGDKAAAERHYRTLLARDPGNIIGQNNLALLLLARGETREAARLADALYKVAPNNADVRDSVGWIYFQTGRKSEALTLLQKLPPDSPSAGAWYHLAVALADKGERKKAAEAARKALALNPDFRYAREAKILAEAAK